MVDLENKIIKTAKLNIRVIQLIDSLDPGGAERMAVNLANELVDKIDLSGIVVTRKEGDLKAQLDKKLPYLFLNKKGKIDLKAIFTFKKFLKKYQITHIHAHSSSWFFAVLTFFTYPKIKIVWHDHFGNRLKYNNGGVLLRLFSMFFSAVIVVNEDLKQWAETNLFISNSNFIPNFSRTTTAVVKETFLKGQEGKRIVCVANLKHPKNHLFLMDSFFKSNIYLEGWTLHLIGKDFNDTYSDELKNYIEKNKCSQVIHIYGSCNDISNILHQADVGVLASTYEGFPVTLLEYGFHNLLVLSTSIGYCSKLIDHQNNGYLFAPNDQIELINYFKKISIHLSENKEMALKFSTFVTTQFSSEQIIQQFIAIYRT